ncbi:hypothetical protein SE17_12790 [Kouleothrix aurantiaca]|uniref:Calcineurin-like phosphoesterase domain-containing protein n=1 Tax=Kouleothrix aurantiaca TaxID=186479 RepID=A0A0P9D4Q4_9CHLR|nr:hypothetical protein SE17_12790 [Kouleothrix aurantiaca]
MPSFTILHTNDMHGRIAGLARVATLVAQARAAQPNTPVLYMDAGDSEDTSVRLSNLTKGTAMHYLLSAAGCDAATVGNAAPMRYGAEVLADHAAAARYPLLLANLRNPDGSPVPGVQLRAIREVAGLRLGLLGITAGIDGSYEQWFGLKMPEPAPLVRKLAAALRQDGADLVVLLSHMGLPDDRELAAALQGSVDIIIGAHTHDLLPSGEQIGSVLVAQAGDYAQHLGRIDVVWEDGQVHAHATVLLVPEDTPESAAVLAEVARLEDEVAQFLSEPIGELAAPLDFAADRECGVGNLMADALRERFPAARIEEWAIHECATISDANREGTTPAQRRPLVAAYWERCDPDYVDGEGAESFVQLIARADAFRQQLRELSAEFALFVGHGLFTRTLLWLHFARPTTLDAQQMRAYRGFISGFQIPNASVLKVYRNSARELLFGAPSVAHLPPELRPAVAAPTPRTQED